MAVARRHRRRGERPLGRLGARRARRRRGRARQGPPRRRAPRGSPAGSCATTTARRRSPSWCGCRWRCSRRTRRPTGSGRWATSPRCPSARWTTWWRSASSTSGPGYESELVIGAEACREYLTWSWPDWEAPVEALLHERRGGWADAMQTVRRLAARARGGGRRDPRGRGGGAASSSARAASRRCVTSDGRGRVRDARAGAGAVGRALWAAGPRPTVDVAASGAARAYWKAQEGEFALARRGLQRPAGSEAPVVHLDQAGPLRSDRDGRVLVDGPWGIYFRMGRTGTGITGGGLPVLLSTIPSSTRTARTTPSTRPSRRSRSSSPRAWRPRCGASAAGAGDWRVTRRRRHRRPHPRQLPGLRLGAAERVRDRRLRPRLQDAGHRPAGGGRHARRRRAAARAVPAASASRAATLHAASKGPYPWT